MTVAVRGQGGPRARRPEAGDRGRAMLGSVPLLKESSNPLSRGGRGIVNPIATIESVRMMLDHMDQPEAAKDVHRAVSEVLGSGQYKTRDMGGSTKTHEMGEAVKDAILKG